jgi:hypothetical protein
MVKFPVKSPEYAFVLPDTEDNVVHDYECLVEWMKFPGGMEAGSNEGYCRHTIWYRPMDAIVEWMYNHSEGVEHYEG